MKAIVLILSVLASVTLAVRKEPPRYNGDLKYFIADLGPSFPCHPHFDSLTTYFDWTNWSNDYEYVR